MAGREVVSKVQSRLWEYANATRESARRLRRDFEISPIGDGSVEVAPVVFLYCYALELHLKAFVMGEGANHLTDPPDGYTIGKTRSLPWLGQLVSRIVRSLGWEQEFYCDGIANLREFKTVLEGINEADPGAYIYRPPLGDPASPSQLMERLEEFSRRMEALLELLVAMDDAIAAMWIDDDDPGLPIQ